MFGDTDLPLALIMEEILGWEKKPDQKDEEEEENQQKDTTSKKMCIRDRCRTAYSTPTFS